MSGHLEVSHVPGIAVLGRCAGVTDEVAAGVRRGNPIGHDRAAPGVEGGELRAHHRTELGEGAPDVERRARQGHGSDIGIRSRRREAGIGGTAVDVDGRQAGGAATADGAEHASDVEALPIS